MWKYYNPNPAGRAVGDCVVRALSAATGMTWEEAFSELCEDAFNMADMPSSNSVLGAALRKRGFYRIAVPDKCPDCYNIENFCREHPLGVFVVGTGSHVVTVIDGNYYDSWDSGNEIPVFFWYLDEGSVMNDLQQRIPGYISAD